MNLSWTGRWCAGVKGRPGAPGAPRGPLTCCLFVALGSTQLLPALIIVSVSVEEQGLSLVPFAPRAPNAARNVLQHSRNWPLLVVGT